MTGARKRYDVVVVGARCAGAATAMLLARRGLRVLAVDRGRYGSDTLSTHALMRGGVLQLHRWGLLDAVRRAGTPAVRHTTFYYGDESVALPIKERDGVDALYAPRRTVIDPILVDAARRAGAEVRFGVRLADLRRDDDGRVRGVVLRDGSGEAVTIDADLIIGADGVRSSVARLAGAAVERQARHTTAVAFGYWEGLGVEGYHWYYRPGVGAGAIPTNDGLTCVFLSLPPERFQRELRADPLEAYHRGLAELSGELAATVARGSLRGGLRTFPGRRGYLRQARGPGWALVGDAGYFKDPLTAHGMTDALRDAELLARAAAAGTDEAMAGYAGRRDELSAGFFDATEAVASFEWDLPAIQRVHLEMSREMNREVEALLKLDRETELAA